MQQNARRSKKSKTTKMMAKVRRDGRSTTQNTLVDNNKNPLESIIERPGQEKSFESYGIEVVDIDPVNLD